MADIDSYTESEEQIFQAALKEFARYGKKGSRLQNIADEAGCNKALVHYYFRNKEKLFEAVSNYVFRELFNAINDAITDAPTFKQTLASFVEVYINYLKKYGVYPLLMYKGMELEELQARHKKVIQEFGKLPSRVFVEKIEQAIDAGEIRPVDPEHTFMSIMGSCVYLFVAYPVLSLSNEQLEENMDEVIEERKEHIVDLIFNGLKPEKEQ